MRDLNYESEWVPESLQIFLGLLFPSKLKQISIGQCITQASRRRSLIAPIPFGIGVDLDKSFATRWFVDHLAKLGFSVSSGEVKLFKESAIASSKEQIDANRHETQEQPPTNQPSNQDDENANRHVHHIQHQYSHWQRNIPWHGHNKCMFGPNIKITCDKVLTTLQPKQPFGFINSNH